MSHYSRDSGSIWIDTCDFALRVRPQIANNWRATLDPSSVEALLVYFGSITFENALVNNWIAGFYTAEQFLWLT